MFKMATGEGPVAQYLEMISLKKSDLVCKVKDGKADISFILDVPLDKDMLGDDEDYKGNINPIIAVMGDNLRPI